MDNILELIVIIAINNSIVDENVDTIFLFWYNNYRIMNKELLIKSLGLNEKQAKIYLASLRLGPNTAGEIAKIAKLKRTTTYFVLEQLKEKGIVSIKKTKKITLYSVISPKTILEKIKRQETSLEQALPELEKLYKEQLHKPKIETFEGLEGVRQVYQDMEKYLSAPEGVMYFGSVAHFFEPEYYDLQENWVRLSKNKKNKCREILNSSGVNRLEYFKEVWKSKNPNYQVRVMPKGINMLNNDNGIYGNKLTIFSLQKEIFVVVIESEDIAQAYRNFFELAWRQAKPLRPKK
ncbi:MAG: helix-turn-helix domain-containing protein [bacterium]